MKKNLFIMACMAMFMLAMTSFMVENQSETKLTVTTDENGEIASVTCNGAQFDRSAWHIRDLSGMTNIRNKPNGKVCMKLKAHTQYDIYSNGQADGWLCISSIYNIREGYWVRLHSSSTGTYWIAKSILF